MSPFTISRAELSRYESVRRNYPHLYTHATRVPARSLLVDRGTISIWILEGLSHSAHFFATDQFKRTYTPNSLYLFTLPFRHHQRYYHDSLRFIQQIAPEVSPTQIVVLANSVEDLISSHNAGMERSFLCNHNCWLDPNLFNIQAEEKIYDLVINTRPEPWKRPELAADVAPLAIIQGNNYRKDQFFDLTSLNPAYINSERLSPEDVVSILNKSCCGGSFSRVEGACYSSSEYLLCGLPVVSTPSLGGRDVWYDQFNAVIVTDESPAGVKEAVDRIKSLRSHGLYDPKEIRARHIFLQNQFIHTFKQKLSSWLESSGVILNIDEWFTKIYRHKMTRYAPWPTVRGGGGPKR